MSVAITTSTSDLLHEEPSSAAPNACVGLDLNQAAVSCVLKQEPISVTLNGPAIFTLSMALALIIHFLEPRGYIRIAWLRLWAIRDPFTAPDPDPSRLPKRGILRQADDPHHRPLPYRPGPRPQVAGIAPQRQLDQHGTAPHYHALRRTLEKLAAGNPARFGTARSCLEKHGLGLFARHPVNVTCNGEVCHVHDSDHSLHMNLHPEDIREVLAKGWGQRHPLAWKGRLVRMPVPEEFVMVYAPRDDHELRIVCRIIEAAIWYVVSEKTEIHVERAA
ncbi:uncharacterized protein ColSpa_02490 [Colletotrichum spaethianum]|uniref:Luciferase domain-containing protein n=1 Tax=Colletotrichum spaethianum TaxID=700344 RepID=A0AA37L7Z1_9PEZI|nr:uncharacterized protein ColSpa_02490 [Colletotrichum spaethianum]GKT42309.1 hypothetical protein ColSpa_02490 [Colletotrichum spaethianum]